MMKLALSTDFGSAHHWERLVTFARAHAVDRLVFWSLPKPPPFLFPGFPGWLTDGEKVQRVTNRRKMAVAAQLTKKAGMEFWYCFQVLMVPDLKRVRTITPRLFNEYGEPDMAGEAIYKLIEDQLDEILVIAPGLAGIELWVMEAASVVISRLEHQLISNHDICGRIVETVYRKCRQHGLTLSVDLHTAGGHRATLEGLLAAARTHPDIIVSADNVIGDFHLHLPFNQHLWRAAATNPVQVHFDLNGEYWGRNFFPTCALSQYKEHIHEARMLGAACVNGRVSTAHDRWSPHFNVLPSRRSFYLNPETASMTEPLSDALEVCCFDTLGGFNAEFFCQCARDASVDRLNVVCAFLKSEFGENCDDLALVLTDVEGVAARVFYAGQNYFNAQSVLPSPYLAHFFALDLQLTAPPGEPIIPHDLPRESRVEFAGWPIPTGLRATGARALMEEKRQALADTEKLLDRAERAAKNIPPEPRFFILRQFTDLVFFARAAKTLLEAMVHYYHILAGSCDADIPDLTRLAELDKEMEKIGRDWLKRQPNDEWKVASRLSEWQNVLSQVLDHKGQGKFMVNWIVSAAQPSAGKLDNLNYPKDKASLQFKPRSFAKNAFLEVEDDFCDLHLDLFNCASDDVLVYFANRFSCSEPMELELCLGYDGPVKAWIDGKQIMHDPKGTNPARPDKTAIPWKAEKGNHELIIAIGSNNGRAWGIFAHFRRKDIPPRLLKREPVCYSMPALIDPM